MPWGNNEQQEIENIIIRGAQTAATLEQIIWIEINDWKSSQKLKWMDTGNQYYRNETDIKTRDRKSIGGERDPNLANNKIANAFIRKLVDQKTGYLLGKPMSIQTSADKYLIELNNLFNKEMLRKLKSTGRAAINNGAAWWYVYYNDESQLSFKLMDSKEIIPIWKDESHTVLDAVIRDYEVIAYEGIKQTTVRKVEWHDTNGVRRFVVNGSQLIEDVEAGAVASHISMTTKNESSNELEEIHFNWERVPFICWKYNEEEQPLVEIIKSLVDDYDRNKSDNSNNLEDLPNSMWVVKGYGGTSAGEIRKNMARYRIIKIDDPDGNSGVDTLSIEIDTEAYKNHQEQNRKDIYEFGRGVDTQGVDIGSAPSGVALKFLYSDLDIDADLIETEFQASLEQLRWFIDTHLYNTTGIDYGNEKVEFIFNRDMPIDETSIITGIKDSVGILSDETLVAQHPYVTDVKEELIRKEQEKQKAMKEIDDYRGLGGDPNAGGDDGE